MGSTWWSSGPVVVMVPSGGVASGGGGGGVEARCNRCYERRPSFSLHMCYLFGWSELLASSYVEHVQVFSATRSFSILLAPEIISEDYRRT